ncbi:unnamed protein product [Triticum turgidum subsp. durum]|uniref:BHLH domain-containing protein n=1 Tax=Triticum turgidum subsp. durum TaxID=4567 RepID=A0A9R0XW76_TRITD|nr:unnamed protein product [Triticum turgidum subsp. durum]
MAKDNAPPATSSDSMSSGKGSKGSKASSRMVLGGAIDKGKGVPKVEEQEEGCRSKGKIMTAPVVAARSDGRSGGRRGDRELHLITERERRRRMSEMFTKLHGLLPTLPDKVDKSSIVMEAIHYIKSLEGTVSELEKQKLERDFAAGGKLAAAANDGVSSSVAAAMPMGMATPTWSGPNVVLSLSGNYAYIHMSVARRPGVLTMVTAVLEKHGIDVVTTGISSDRSQCIDSGESGWDAAQLLAERVEELMSETIKHAAATAKRYGTGKVWVRGRAEAADMEYVLAQCTPDLTEAECWSCLNDTRSKLQTSSMHDKVPTSQYGGRLVGVRCSLRYERVLFFEETSSTLELHKPREVN